MFSFDHWREITQTIARHKLRTTLTALGVFWGGFLVVVLLGMGSGLEQGVSNIFKDDAFNSIWYSDGQTAVPFAGFKPGRPIRLTIQDLQAIRDSVPGLSNITPRKTVQGDNRVTAGAKSGLFEILGVYPGYAAIEKTLLRTGRLLNPLDVREARRVVLIGSHVVDVLFGDTADPVGEYVTIQGTNFLVVGTFTDEGGEGELQRIYVPFSTFRQTFDPSPEIDYLIFTVNDGTSSAEVDHTVRRYLAARHQFDHTDRSAVYSYNNLREYEKFQALFWGINVFITVVGLGTLFAGLVGVGNIMLIAVKERTREIGIRKAIGATPRSIINLILQEALLITSVAGFLGVFTAIGVVEAVRQSGLELEYFRNPHVDWRVAFGAMMVLVVGGLTAGLLPASQAGRIRPIEALQHE